MSHKVNPTNIVYDLVLALVCASLVVLVLFLFVILCKRKSKSVEPQENTTITIKPNTRPYALTDVDAATDSFNQRRIIGKGRLGTVYWATLTNGDVVAIKRIDPHLVLSNAGSSFLSSIKSISAACHPNLVPIVGYAEAPCERIIISEFMCVKSLEYHLHEHDDDGGTAVLDWRLRLRIAGEAARAIEYLHEGKAPFIVHGCIKPSNIMIDLNFHAKVCDYGLSFLGPQEWKGLVGYLDKEYWMEKGGFCKACDVYSFGVVLLELLSGRRCEEGLIVEWALPLIKAYRVFELLDPRLMVPLDMKPLVRMAKVALACVGNTRKNRPTISQVSAILNSLVFD